MHDFDFVDLAVCACLLMFVTVVFVRLVCLSCVIFGPIRLA